MKWITAERPAVMAAASAAVDAMATLIWQVGIIFLSWPLDEVEVAAFSVTNGMVV